MNEANPRTSSQKEANPLLHPLKLSTHSIPVQDKSLDVPLLLTNLIPRNSALPLLSLLLKCSHDDTQTSFSFLPSFFLSCEILSLSLDSRRRAISTLRTCFIYRLRRETVINYFNLVEFSSRPTKETRYFDLPLLLVRMRFLGGIVADTSKEIYRSKTPPGNYNTQDRTGRWRCMSPSRYELIHSSSRNVTLRLRRSALFNSHDFGKE